MHHDTNIKEKKSLKQKMGRYYIAATISIPILLLLTAKYFIMEGRLEFITLNSLSSSIIAGAIFITGFLLAGVFSDYKEADKIPAEMRSILESIIAEGDALFRKDAGFAENNQQIKHIAVRFIHEFEEGLSHMKDHSHVEHALAEIRNFDEIFDDMERRGVPPNYMTRIKTEQSNLKKLLLRVYHIQKTKFVPSIVFLMDSMAVLGIALMLFVKTDYYIGFVQVGIISYILLYVRHLIIVLEKPFRKGKDDTEDDVSIFVLRELLQKLESEKGIIK